MLSLTKRVCLHSSAEYTSNNDDFQTLYAKYLSEPNRCVFNVQNRLKRTTRNTEGSKVLLELLRHKERL